MLFLKKSKIVSVGNLGAFGKKKKKKRVGVHCKKKGGKGVFFLKKNTSGMEGLKAKNDNPEVE